MSLDQALIQRVVSGLISNSVVPIIGAGCSVDQVDDAGHKIHGFPLARDFVKIVQQKRAYLTGVDNFEAANILIESQDGPAVLAEYLVHTYSPARPLPTYELLVNLPFDTAISFNFDESFELSLSTTGRTPSVVIEDSDVPFARLSQVKIIKPHGTISKPASIRATRTGVGNFDTDCPLVRSLLEVLLADRDLLFIGYGFGDEDIVGAVRRVRTWVGSGYRRATAIMKSVSLSQKAELNQLNIDIIEGDAVKVLGEIAAEYIKLGQNEASDSERWRAHPFFRELISIRGRPTETQVVNALLNATDNRLGTIGVQKSILHAAEAAKLCLSFRPNYAGLKHVSQHLERIAESENDDIAWREWRRYQESRNAARREIADKVSGCIGSSRTLLLYSQSQRVIDFLCDIEPFKRRSIELIIPECRAKSPVPFQNAILITERLADAGFKSIQIVVDVVGIHQLCDQQVDMVLMGVHKVFQKDKESKPIGIVNAVGSEAFSVAAASVDVPVVFVYEQEKVVSVDSIEEAKASISYDPECDLSSASGFNELEISKVATLTQIGYDFVPWRKNMQVVTEG